MDDDPQKCCMDMKFAWLNMNQILPAKSYNDASRRTTTVMGN
jgi:hypothetical protein